MPAGVPIIPFTPKNLINKEKDKKNESKDVPRKEDGKIKNKDNIMNNVFIPNPIFINQMNKISKNNYNKFQIKKMRPFTERTGDWICKNCRNLNFAFRIECNRCKLPKKEVIDNSIIIKENNNNKDLNVNVYMNNNNIFNPYKNSYQNKNKYKTKNHLQNNNSDKKCFTNSNKNNKECCIINEDN